jgi:hypothetical protein
VDRAQKALGQAQGGAQPLDHHLLDLGRGGAGLPEHALAGHRIDQRRPAGKRTSFRSTRQNVRMYVCGPTVYDRAHLGNARPVVVFDTLYRLLRHVYGADHVTYVRNFTDVDDKINATALRANRRPARWRS